MSFNLKNTLSESLISAIFATCLTFILIALATLVKLLFNLDDNVVQPVARIIKPVAVIIAGLVFIRGDKGFIKGIFFGMIFALLITVFFSLVSGVNQFTANSVLELLIYVVLGAVTGTVSVNLKK